MQCIEKKKKDSVCYVPEERIEKGGKRIKENDAICRETDGESAPAVDEKKKKEERDERYLPSWERRSVKTCTEEGETNGNYLAL